MAALYLRCQQHGILAVGVRLKQVCFSSSRTCLNRINRHAYRRMYPSTLVLQDGSTIVIRYSEPRKIIQIPTLTSELTADQRLARQRRHKPKAEVKVTDDIEAAFNAGHYSHLWKKG